MQNFGRGALLLDISGIIVEKPPTNNRIEAISQQVSKVISDRLKENSLFDIVEIIRQAKTDSNITGIVMDLKNFVSASQASMQYIGKAIKEFRASGKPVIAIGDSYSQWQYYLASFANKIWLAPYGNVDLHGFSINNLYYKSLLEKLKVTTYVFRVGTYKSAVEPFIRDNMSPIVRKSTNHLISELWNNYVTTMATNRQLTSKQMFPGAQDILNKLQKLNGDTSEYALNNKLVDTLGYRADMEEALIKQFGWSKKDKKFCAISLYDYYPTKKSSENSDSIAVIFVNGIIANGNETPGNVGSDTTVAQIRKARLDPKVKAIILRVNSPGGSVNASEMIRTELAATSAIGKPIIVSMGNVAASGGYWISTPANYIIADDNTITGSIGIFGIMHTLENSLDYIGVHTDGVVTSQLADISTTKSLPQVVLQMMQLSIENNYKRFLRLVAESRKSTLEQIDKIAQGHVWTGKDAKNNGLVDKLGDFDDAIIKAVELAKLKQWRIDYYQDEPPIFNTILNNIVELLHITISKYIQHWLPNSFSADIDVFKTDNNTLTTFNDPKYCYALCLNCNTVS